MLKAIIFDLDGTTLDSIEGILVSLNEANMTHKLKPITVEMAKNFIGDGVDMLVKRSIVHSRDIAKINSIDNDLFKRVKDTYMDAYEKNRISLSKEFDNVSKTLSELKSKGIILGILSNKPHVDTVPMIKYFFNDLFDIVYGSCDKTGTKPDTKGIDFILNELQIEKDEILYVGDSDIDLYLCENAKIKSVYCTYGYAHEGILERHKPDFIIDKFEDIKNII